VELGLVVIDRYESGNADGGGVLYTPPPQSERALERNARLRAELSRATSETPTTEPSSSE